MWAPFSLNPRHYLQLLLLSFFDKMNFALREVCLQRQKYNSTKTKKNELHQRGERLKQKLLEMVQVTVPIFILMKSEKKT